ncbi:molybdenum cofactor guanylyltransferase [Frigoriglobus tundricola]|uniref:Probable molybdenum cofactor guanylyltransferase n=1 Tax=Frigoriglobus tundricola TaxID=2774151 RepID=A0A6M5YN56_9BACT|nr:NTP transferase domain-containing protein [Frigoriglobus tundricola]QJW94994.1 Molybdopterin-guanine dinucleotide biosynthesis protein MobA [Frigoriglobus tundricola]
MKTAGIVLCGGRSARMGAPKAWLPFDGEFMLARVVRVVREAVGPVVVVAAPGQDLPPLPAGTVTVRDEEEGQGPLAGLAAGLAALEGTTDAAYLSSCDAPFLRAAFVRRVVGSLSGGREAPVSLSAQGAHAPRSVEPVAFASVPRVNDRLHPLAAVYRVGVLPTVRAMLAARRLRMTDLFDRVPTRVIGPDELSDADPELVSLLNVNTPEEYEAARKSLS